jgi:GTPase
MDPDFRSGFVAIIGPPNVGKSTLLNSLIGEKVSIVTPKPQTTRNRIQGVKNLPHGQLIFIDTPGIHETQQKLNRRLVKAAWGALKECDVVLVMVEANQTQPGEDFSYARKGLTQAKKPVILVINKIDLVEKKALLPLIDTYRTLYPFQEIVPLCALKGSGVQELADCLLQYLPEGPQYFPEETYTDQPERFLVAEIIREKIFLRARQEIPYSTSVEINEFKVRDDGVTLIRASIWVEKPSQKGILIGKQGKMLKEIGTSAREEIERLLGEKLYLELWVTVKKNWTANETMIRHALKE